MFSECHLSSCQRKHSKASKFLWSHHDMTDYGALSQVSFKSISWCCPPTLKCKALKQGKGNSGNAAVSRDGQLSERRCIYWLPLDTLASNIFHHHHVPCQMPFISMVLPRSCTLVFWTNSVHAIPPSHHLRLSSIICLSSSVSSITDILIHHVSHCLSCRYMTREYCLFLIVAYNVLLPLAFFTQPLFVLWLSSLFTTIFSKPHLCWCGKTPEED